jgi:hypothetical protein
VIANSEPGGGDSQARCGAQGQKHCVGFRIATNRQAMRGYWLGIGVGSSFTAAAICHQQPEHPVLPEVVTLNACSPVVSSMVYPSTEGQLVGPALGDVPSTTPIG